MNAIIDNIINRRSVRSYERQEISRDILDKIIEAGSWAPTGANVQPWRFVVVQDDSFIKKLQDIAVPKYWKWFERASAEMQAGRKPIDAVVDDPVYYSAPVIVFVIATKTMTYAQDCSMVC